MFGTKKLTISKKDGLVAYEVALEKANYDVLIENGLQCVTYTNGVKGKSLYASTQKTVVNNKRGDMRIVAVDMASVFPVRCGCSGVSYTDYEIDQETTVGMNGVAEIKVINPNRFVDVFTANEVGTVAMEDYFRTNFSQAMSMALSATLNRCGKDADKELFTMGEQLKQFLSDKVTTLGISVEKFTVNGICFQEGYEQARRDYFDKKKENKEAKKQKREAQEDEDREIDILERISKMNQKTSNADDAVYCQVCGMKNKSDDAFCVKCGNKLR